MKSRRTTDERADIVVIGSGPGGSVTACLLAEAGRDVMLLEEGADLAQSSCEQFSSQEMTQKYRNGGITVTLGNSQIVYVEGSCSGGGSEINSGLCTRISDEVLEEWSRTHDVRSLTASDLDPHFAASERELQTALSPDPAPASGMLEAGANRMGWKSREVPRWVRFSDSPDGSGTTVVRNSMTETLIPRARAAGLRMRTGARAVKLKKLRGRWEITVTDSSKGGSADSHFKVSANVVFIACGATHTPALLLRSGIRNNIGKALRLHPMLKVVARFADSMISGETGMPARQIHEFSPRLGFGCSISKSAYLATSLLGNPEHLKDVDKFWQNMAAFYVSTRGGKGSVHMLPGFRDPLVRFHLSERELQELSEGFFKLCQVLFSAGAQVVYPGIRGFDELRSENDLTLIPDMIPAGDLNLTTVHLMGGCPMGENKSICATDSYGQMHGQPGLYVADSSLFCGSLGTNPQATIMAVARRNAAHFLAQT
jgi:choline dehydrogenase-like flavoprotein